MKRTFLLGVTAVLLSSMAFYGFQCGSPEFTGAKVAMNQKDFKRAMDLLQTEVQKNPGNEEAWFLLGQLRSEAGDYAAMNVAFTEALKLSDKHAREIKQTRYNRWANAVNAGVAALQRASSDSMQYYDTAIQELTKAASAWPDTSVTYRYLGYSYAGKGDLDGALNAYGEAWKKGKDTESHKRAGRIYLQRGRDLDGQFKAENADKIRGIANLKQVEKGTGKGDVMKMLGAPDNVKKGSRGTRKEDWTYTRYNLVLNMDGDRVAGKNQTAPYNPGIDSAKHVLALAEFDKAVGKFEEVKNVDPKDNENLNLLMQGYVESDRIKEAITGFREAVVNEPSNKTNHYILAVLHRTNNDYDSAIGEFKEALKIDPGYTDALFDLGATYYNWGVDIIRKAQEEGKETDEWRAKFNEAQPYLERVTENRKDDPSVWETLATIYARLGQADKAMKALDAADKIRKGN